MILTVNFTMPPASYEHPSYYEAIACAVGTAVGNGEHADTYSGDGLSDWVRTFINYFYEEVEWFVTESLYIDEVNKAYELVKEILNLINPELININAVYDVVELTSVAISDDKYGTILFEVDDKDGNQ